MNYRDYIVRDPNVCGGQPVFKGTRVLLRTILASLAEGDSFDALREAFPSLTQDHLRAAVAYAAACAAEELPPANPIPNLDASQAR
jgi:uncharacterized protein (DUF433 family)